MNRTDRSFRGPLPARSCPSVRPSALAQAAAVAPATAQEPFNYPALVMFFLFVALTLYITARAARGNKSAADFYAAGGGITGFQNGLAIAGDYMSAASFLGISGLVYTSGFDGLLYSIGFLVGWPILLFLIAERLRNLGKFTFADVASFRLGIDADPVALGFRHACRGRALPHRADGGRGRSSSCCSPPTICPTSTAEIIVGILMIVYVAFGGMKATTWVQIIKAGLLLVRRLGDRR